MAAQIQIDIGIRVDVDIQVDTDRATTQVGEGFAGGKLNRFQGLDVLAAPPGEHNGSRSTCVSGVGVYTSGR